jgi:uncharacterized protein
MDIAIPIVAFLLIMLGFIGSILPILPGPPLAFGGLWLFAWQTDYERITSTALVIFGALTLLTFVVDLLAPALGARGYKSSRYGVIGSFIGAFVGIFVLGPLGVIIGPLAGAFIGEMVYARNFENALMVAWGSFVGFLIGSFFKLVVVFSMLVYFAYVLIRY